MPVSVERIDIISDERGGVLEPLNSVALKFQRNVHLVITVPGAVRGNHYHRTGTENITVMGPARVCFREGTIVRDIAVARDQAYHLVFPPGVAHAIQNTGSRPAVFVAFNTQEHDREHPDTFRDVLIST